MKKKIIPILGAIFLPFIIESIMMLVAEAFYSNSQVWGFIQEFGMMVGFAVGILCILKLPIRNSYRIVTSIIYSPIMVVMMIYWGLTFTGWVFDRWL
jgi:hypothetical protein